MSPVEFGVCIVFALVLLAAIEAPACAWFIGRLKRRARTYTDLVVSRPPVPQSEPVPDTDSDGLSVWPPEALEQAVFDRLFRDMPEVAQDLREAS